MSWVVSAAGSINDSDTPQGDDDRVAIATTMSKAATIPASAPMRSHRWSGLSRLVADERRPASAEAALMRSSLSETMKEASRHERASGVGDTPAPEGR